MTLELLFINLSKETFSGVFFCGQVCCFVPVYYMVQGDGVLTKSRLFRSMILDRSPLFGKSQFQVLFTLVNVNKRAIMTWNSINNACYFTDVQRVLGGWALREITLTLTDISNLARTIPNTTNLLWPKLYTTESIHTSRRAMTNQHFTNKCHTLLRSMDILVDFLAWDEKISYVVLLILSSLLYLPSLYSWYNRQNSTKCFK